MKIDKNIIKAEEGKVLRRIRDGIIFGKELSLGYTYYLCGIKLPDPIKEYPEDYEEISEIQTLEFKDEEFEEIIELPSEENIEEIKEVKLQDLLIKALQEIEDLKKRLSESNQ